MKRGTVAGARHIGSATAPAPRTVRGTEPDIRPLDFTPADAPAFR
jgi:hypothetical protein